MKNTKIQTVFLSICILSTGLFTSGTSSAYAGVVTEKVKEVGNKIETKAIKEKVKDKVHEVANELDKDKINATVDQVADYFDTEKMKETVDQIAEYLDKDKIKQTIDMVSEYLDKDKVKEFIDATAEYLNREKVKESLDMLVDYIDKEKLKKTADNTIDQVSQKIDKTVGQVKAKVSKAAEYVDDSFDKTIDFIKNEVAQASGDFEAVQRHLNSYDWGRMISEKTTSDIATLSDLKLNGYKKIAIVKAGQPIQGEVVCSLDRPQLHSLSKYKVAVGIKNQEGQTTIYNHFGLFAGKEKNTFVLTAPKEKGIYQVEFHVITPASENPTAKIAQARGSENPTIGLIIVR
jgi:predicted metal-dependent hydrolase